MTNVLGADGQGAASLVLAPGVYAPQSDTFLLADALEREQLRPHAEVLDVGTGTGALAIAAARRGARVTAIDRSWRAVAATRINAALNRQKVRVLRGDLLAPAAGRRFDLVLCNPPYVPAPSHRLPRHGAAVAWDAGHDGRAVLDRICDGVPEVLRPAGTLLLVHSALSGVAATLHRLHAAGLDAEVVQRRTIPFGPVLRSRTAWLERRGLIAPGEEKEELVIIRAERI